MAGTVRAHRILAIDVGNSSLHLGLFRRETLVFTRRLSLDKIDEMPGLLGRIGERYPIDGAIAGSVAPRVNPTLAGFVRDSLHVPLDIVGETLLVDLRVAYSPPSSLGIDRLLNGLAADRLFQHPSIVVDLGTAVTLDVVDGKGGFLGGSIAPGLEMMARALARDTELLPVSDLLHPGRVVAGTTEEGLRVGLRVGFAGMVSALIARTREELEGRVEVVATGGGAELLAPDIEGVDTVEPDLTLQGLRIARLEGFRGTT